MIFVLVKDGIVEQCISVNSIADLIEFYPEHEIIEQVGEENIGWTYDGVSFTAPVGG
jgi:hypothetical protein